jgi:hypothetical protein
MTERHKLRIGVLQNGAYASAYIRDLITWAGQQDDLEVTHLFIYGPPGESLLRRWQRKLSQHKLGVIREAALKCIQALEQAVLQRYYGGIYRDHSRPFPIDHLVDNTVHLVPSISKSGLVYRFSADEVAKVRASGCDVLIRGGKGILRGEILDAAPFGILSFHHGDNRVNRGGPAGFWESYLEWPSTGFVIQRLTPELDGGDVLVRGWYVTKWFFLLNQAALFSKANVHFKSLLKKLARARALPPAEDPVPYSARLYRSPTVGQCLHYVARFAARSLWRGAKTLLRYEDRWRVSIIFGDWRRAVLWRARTPAPPPGRFLADPFVWHHRGKTFCLVEDYSFREKGGRISAFQIDKEGATEPKVVLAEPFHLSFPYLFEFEGAIYLCPECSASGQIRLYRSVEFPYRWEFVKAIMTDVSAADTMIFEHGGRWWLLTNFDLPGRPDFRSELYLFSAESPLSESWVPHPMNPLKIDPMGGRNAGLLRDGERLFRAGQVQEYDRYGVGIRLFEIEALSLEHYSERLSGEIQPGFRKGLRGTHHISSTGEVTVVDGYRTEFIWPGPLW